MQIKFRTSTFEYQASNENNKQNVQVTINKSKCKRKCQREYNVNYVNVVLKLFVIVDLQPRYV